MTMDENALNVDSNFQSWSSYNGILSTQLDRLGPNKEEKIGSILYGLDNISLQGSSTGMLEVSKGGAAFGFVISGAATFVDEGGVHAAIQGMYFSIPNGGKIIAEEPETRFVVMQRMGWKGLRVFGGPIEKKGRLRYIDGCSDTCLIPPPLLGDACLNHLHFPEGIDQTAHSHPSVRMGCVADGIGECVTPNGVYDLVPGVIFTIPAGGVHKFRTLKGQHMDVIAYHPDSDFGPTHETHPMINRTWVDGKKIDNSDGHHLALENIEDTSL